MVFILPLCLGILLFVIIPLFVAIYLSFTQYNLFQAPDFILFDNYIRLFTVEAEFWRSILNAMYSALGVPIGILFAMIIASVLSSKIKGVKFFRVAFFVPTLLSAVIVTLLWQWMYDYDTGILNEFMSSIGLDRIRWFSEKMAMPSMIIMGVWGGLGVSILLYLGAINAIDKTLYEAAEVDGANFIQKFRFITFPGVSPITFYILMTGLIGAIQDFTRFQVMTNGVPPTTMMPVLLIYRYSGGEYGGNYGYASALAVILGIIIGMIALFNAYMSRKWVSYDH